STFPVDKAPLGISFKDIRVDTEKPGKVIFTFSLCDDSNRVIDIPTYNLYNTFRIFEKQASEVNYKEIEYFKTGFFVTKDANMKITASYISQHNDSTWDIKLQASYYDDYDEYVTQVDMAEIQGNERQGVITIDSVDIASDSSATILVYAKHIPKEIDNFRFTLGTAKQLTFDLSEGLCTTWVLSDLGNYQYTVENSNSPLSYGSFGTLWVIEIDTIFGSGLKIPFVLDTTIYSGCTFQYPDTIIIGDGGHPPIANAGDDTVVAFKDTIYLHGTGSDDSRVAGFTWKFGNDDWTETSTGDTAILAPSFAQFYICSLCVTDDDGIRGYDDVKIEILPKPWIPVEPLKYQDGMVYIQAIRYGFRMGSEEGIEDERPVHSVQFTYNFWMDTTEVTQEKYDSIMSAFYVDYTTPDWSEYGTGNDYPVYNANWFDAALYCNACSKRDGLDTVYSYLSIDGIPGNDCILMFSQVDYTKQGYRLPSEAEWEYACRGGTTGANYWADIQNSQPEEYAWFKDNSNDRTNPVGNKLPNKYGLYDMNGNVWEWIGDWWNEYTPDIQTDPQGPSNHPSNSRIIRGDAFDGSVDNLSSTARAANFPDHSFYSIGFRKVRPHNPE
ncbi:SUMF1/EgtB/PvdO family nonheme iron enzyme, partial [Fibrobacterota bacterium]